MNFPDSVTVTQRVQGDIDPDTGVPATSTETVLDGVRAAFAVLGAAEAQQSFGDSAATVTETVTASLTLPSWTAQAVPTDYRSLAVTVPGYSGSWRVEAVRPGAQWSTYLLAHN